MFINADSSIGFGAAGSARAVCITYAVQYI